MKGILLDENNDIMFANGDFAIGDITAQTAQSILEAFPGEFKERPLLGFGLNRIASGTVSPFWRGEMRSALRLGLINVQNIEIDTENGVKIEL